MLLAADDIRGPLLILGIGAVVVVLGIVAYMVWVGLQAAGSATGDREAGDAALRQTARLLGGEFRRPPPVRKHRASPDFGAVSGVREGVGYQVSLHKWTAAEIGGSAQLVVWPEPGQQFVLEMFGWKGPRRLPPDAQLEDIFGPEVAQQIPAEFRALLRDLVVDSRAVGASRDQLHVYSPPAVFEWPLKGEPAELAAWVERVLDRSRHLLCPAEVAQPALDPSPHG